MIPIVRPTTDVEWLLYVAATQVGTSETPRNSNRGPKVETYQAATGDPAGSPWCASSLVWCFDMAGLIWPFTRTGYVATIVAESTKRGQLVSEAKARPGDLVAFWHADLNRHAHIGILADREGPATWATYEGNTNDGGSRDGWMYAHRSGPHARTLATKDVVIRWTLKGGT